MELGDARGATSPGRAWLGGAALLLLTAVLVAGLPGRSLAANTIAWTEAGPPAASGTFVALVRGDINEDGHLDLIGGSQGLGIWVAAGDGDGTWTPLGAIITTGTYYGLALGDVDNDGHLDLAGAEDGLGVHVWRGDGSGGWDEKSGPISSGKVWSVALADVNHDGRLDLAAGSGENAGLRVWTGDGAYGWTLASAGLPTLGYVSDLVLGDMDRDGQVDLAAASGPTGVHAWRGNGSGTWTENSSGLPDTGDYYGLALGDLDHDGYLDLVASGDDVGVQAWTGSGGMIWSWVAASSGLPATGDYWDVGLGDLNHDGDLDIAAAGYGSGMWAWTGDGSGTWSGASSGLPGTGDYFRLALGDWDEDGILDLAAGRGGNLGVQAWVDDGVPSGPDGWLQIASPTTSGDYLGLDAGDWNHDGVLDVVASSATTGIQLWEGDGGNTWDEIADWTGPDLPTSGKYDGLALGDLDHNGWLDVVAGSGEDGGLQAWLFQDAVAWIEESGELPASGTFLDIDLGDLDNDGYLDIAAAADGLGVRCWTAEDFDTTGPWWDTASTGLPGSGTYSSVAFGDLNRDGLLDLVAAGEGLGLGVWQGDGTGHWTAVKSPEEAGTWRAVAVGDVNHDARLDIVAGALDKGVYVWAGDGGFGWTSLATPSGSGTYADIALGDLNNDGWLDLVASRSDDGGLQVWTGDGGASWTSFSVSLPTSGSYLAVAMDEIDNDGFLDLVGAKLGGGSVHAWASGDGAAPSGWTGFAPTGWVSDTQKVDCSVQVQDTGSGLKVDTAAYSYLGSSGTWSSWLPAKCSGSDGTHDPQTLTALEVPFGQDSGPSPLYEGNWVKFRIEDTAGNVGTSGEYLVKIDTTPPDNPNTFTSSHWPGVWEDDATVDVEWDGASDATSGVWRYSYIFDPFCELPDTVVDLDATDKRVTSPELADGEWYLSVRTRDQAGVWSPEAACDGPYRIDTAPPTNPTGYTSSHDVGVWSQDNTIYMSWTGADDPGSGVFGYSYFWSQSPTTTPDETVDTTGTHTTSAALADGDSWYFHIRTRDAAGNWASGAQHWGPFYIDRTAPQSCWIFAPPVSYPPAFLVQWHYEDPTSGVASYDVQVRDGAGGTWTDWQMATSATNANYTGAVPGHSYYFRVRARDQAGNLSLYDCQTESLVYEDLVATGLEVTQGIQNLAHDVTLIANKTTYVRFYVHSSFVDVAGVTAELHGSRGGVALPGSPLAPTRGPITAQVSGGDRANLDDAFYFRLPNSWRSGTVTLRGVVNPGHAIPESDDTDNEVATTVTFESGPTFCIVFIPVHLTPFTYAAGDAGFWDMIELMRWLYPVSDTGVGLYTGSTLYPDWFPFVEYDPPDDYEQILRDLNQRDFWTIDPCHETHYFGMIHPDSFPGGPAGMARRPGDVGLGVMYISTSGWWPEPAGGRIMAHELGHNFGRKHVWCTGCEADGGAVDESYPYEETVRHVCDDPTPYTCRFGPDSATAYYGLWPYGSGGPVAIEPVGTGDLMSYFGRRWISDYTYHALLRKLRDLASARAVSQEALLAASPAWSEATEYLFASGTISPTGGTAELAAFYRTTEPDAKFVRRSFQQELGAVEGPDTYSLVLEDAGGTPLYTHTFTATALTDGNTSPANAIFGEVLPYDPATARVVLKQGTQELASREVSAHAPTVTVLSPNGGESISDHLLISWSAADADGDELRYTVQYSADDGATWRALATDWVSTTFAADATDLASYPGSDQARIRVIATDGVNTGQDQSDGIFSLAPKPPLASILEPATGHWFAAGETVVLRGAGLDAEDGRLAGAASFAWASSLDGSLGSGEELWLDNLSTGAHHITLTVTDSDGLTGTDEILILVGVSENRIYLPLVLRND